MNDTTTRESSQAWLFQAQPKSFDIDGFLATLPKEFLWLARQHGAEILPGDTVFLWRAIGKDERAKSGIIATARVISGAVQLPEDPASIPFWVNPADAVGDHLRVRLELVRVAERRQVLQRDWLSEDPILRDLAVFRMAQGTNYPISTDQAARLNALWSRIGRDWNYAESVAGLWAYVQTYGAEVSRLPRSPVAEIAIAIGRVVPDVYDKVMKFRAIDPRDSRAGMSGAGAMDRKVWTQFYDVGAGEINADALEAEFRGLWINTASGQPPDLEDARESDFEYEVRKLTSLSLETLAERLGAAEASAAPVVSVTITQRFHRDPLVAAFARVRAGFRCEIPDCAYPAFEGKDGQPYSEVHHIDPLAEGGRDTRINVACICPAHHREAHFGKRASEIRVALTGLRRGSPA